MNQLNNLRDGRIEQPVEYLLRPIKFGDHAAKNRIFFAPLTRCRAVGHVPNELMREYYTQRASAGLLITECTMVTPKTSAFAHEPGIFSEEQVAGWRKITDSVHEQNGLIFCQIWHAGRAAHPALNDGAECVAPSAIAIDGEAHTPEGKLAYTMPRAMSVDEIKATVQAFKQAALQAKAAGFDGVEVHGANGYLIDQFLRDGTNQRTDEYGGSVENRCRFLFEILEAVCEVMGSGSVGLRLSPINGFNDIKDSDPVDLSTYLALALNDFNLAYTHIIRGDQTGQTEADIVKPFSDHYEGALILNMGYDADTGAREIENGTGDAISYGRHFLANPDLPERFKQDAKLNEPNPDTFYTQGSEGYTDYPALDER